jgi:hypothetical protein
VKVPRPGLTVRARRALPMAAPALEQKELLASTIRNPQVALELPCASPRTLRATPPPARCASS